MKQSYEKIFHSRAKPYDEAMRRFLHARDEEFKQLIDRVVLKPGMVVADVPAGGGYLKHYLPDECQLLCHEPCAGFSESQTLHTPTPSLLPLPWSDSTVDVAMSLAGVHHMDDKRPLFRELYRTVKAGGYFILSDVARNSDVAIFLDDYVGKFNSTGHEGNYLDEATLTELKETGWTIESTENSHFHWKFSTLLEIPEFCNMLFDISKPDTHSSVDEIESFLPIDKLQDGKYGLRWQLMTVVAKKL
ncbi:hypothetical protein BOW35_09165 [Solemya velum gill symbiont]|uniref:class I SAM-dependent methyltransferase n=1 Tax=Solemya velum gill symbiont TaxID=2340 RepID=UPI00099732FC|nr:methyltransferase domain-containing protein [Solemya velum gill symbiont]OOZ14200.1 hypothetical protein BOW27_07995 [Solemya velum gill symbiont]OOZ16943.1 hypothetical protein BOW28_08070 [Solemya velum gill symbiont]OOZ19320.1 hypothetical protein BOW29_07715 [Solemya velum gill symbiont]OOZ21042.1 hypothetical protein BOW30_11555 [Solemya velum gill symbiont]OOZ23885.1 hypothetical protein BOW31_08720 [Solemya velum gill symbiont]